MLSQMYPLIQLEPPGMFPVMCGLLHISIIPIIMAIAMAINL